MPERQKHATRNADRTHHLNHDRHNRSAQLDCAAHGGRHTAARSSGKSGRERGMEDKGRC